MTPPTHAKWTAPLLVLPFTVILFFHARYYWPFISDDALISLRYAARLIDGRGLTWTEGHPVEGYSNLLWVLAVAALGSLRIDLIAAARLLGALGVGAIMIALSWCYVRKEAFRTAWLPVIVALLFLALGAPMAVWAIGGLEQPLLGALLAASIPLTFDVLESREVTSRRILTLSVVLGLLCLTRPDGPLFAATVAGSVWLAGHGPRRARIERAVRLLLFPVLLTAGQLLFRLAYYGEWVPNTALVKVTPSKDHWLFGWRYLSGGLSALSPWSYIALGALPLLVAVPAFRMRGGALLAMSSVWAAYVVFIGGDIFPAYRHFVPLMVLMAFSLAEGGRLLARSLRHRPRTFYLAGGAALLLFIPYTTSQFADRQNLRATRERWEWDCRELGLLLKAAFRRQQPLVAVTAAGCLPYWSELPSLDMLGLNDYYLPRHPPTDVGTGFIGHELGDGRYVLGRQPDMIVFNVGSGPAYRSGTELSTMPEFLERYIAVPLEVSGLEFVPVVYFNKYSRKSGLGIMTSSSTIEIPGFLFTGAGTVAFLEGGRKLAARLPPGGLARVAFRATDSVGGWAVEIRSAPAAQLVGHVEHYGGVATVTVRGADGSGEVPLETVTLRRGR